MTELERNGLRTLAKYNELKRNFDKTGALLIALRNSGGPRIPSEHLAVKQSTGATHLNTDTVIREFSRIVNRREKLLEELCAIERLVESLPETLAGLIQWRYFVFAKREAIAKRLKISLRHFSRLRKKALEILGEKVSTSYNGVNVIE